MSYTLIANSGIQMITFRLQLDTAARFKEWFHEWYDPETGEWRLELAQEVKTDEFHGFYSKKDLYRKGYLSGRAVADADPAMLNQDGIKPLRHDDEMCAGVPGELFSLTFTDRDFKLSAFENRWLPVPYFFKRTATRFNFGPLNWARLKLVPADKDGDVPPPAPGVKVYDAILAFDTRTSYTTDENNEQPFFRDNFADSMDFELCENEMMLTDFCASREKWSYVDAYIFGLVHPGVSGVNKLRGPKVRHMAYIASYIFLMNFLSRERLLPAVKLYKDIDVEARDVDMVVDIGNSRTTALLVEDNRNFNQVRPLQLLDLTNPVRHGKDGDAALRIYDDPFDMRLVFRRADFGNFGPRDSRQFVYPSLVRLGTEAQSLLNRAAMTESRLQGLSTYSSPKRYLWDWRPNKEEWQFMVLDGEADDHELTLPGVTELLSSDGRFAPGTGGGPTSHYSRRSLMTLSFLEMLVQARMQINSAAHRDMRTGLGYPEQPRRIRRIIVTCPTAMSKVEREALADCARQAVAILAATNPELPEGTRPVKVEVIPELVSHRDEDAVWYYDEATCSQLVYMYGEVGHKYKGSCAEFFNLYGRMADGDAEPSITVGSLDIGAGTSDLMISKYTCRLDDVTTITPEPLFYDSFYFAGDDMLAGLIKNVMLLGDDSAFREALRNLSPEKYRQKMKDFFGPDHNGQTLEDRLLRKDFNIQYSVPVMHYFLELLSRGARRTEVRFADVFGDNAPNDAVIEGFKARTGIDVRDIVWHFDPERVNDVCRREFEPLLKKIATIMHAYGCDIVLLSGRPASLPAVRDVFLQYYAVAPDRLIILNNYYVGDWYPFSNNTGYISNPKTIVAMGGIIGHYAASLANLNRFVINLDKLRENLRSTVNYIEASREGQPVSYIITPAQTSGTLSVSRMPTHLNVRRLGMETYPCRSLYSIDFNRHRMKDRILRKAFEEGVSMTDAQIAAAVNEQVESLKRRMPFTLTIERDIDDKENLSITAITDRNGDDVLDSYVEIHIQSLGAEERYWLDSGEFNF